MKMTMNELKYVPQMNYSTKTSAKVLTIAVRP